MKLKHLFSLAAVLVATVMAFAFSSEATPAPAPTLTAWFQYEGPATQTDLQVKDHNNYKYRPTAPTCTGNLGICAVQYNYTGTLVNGLSPDDFPVALETKIVQDRDEIADYVDITEKP
jgi:hypothetical protein